MLALTKLGHSVLFLSTRISEAAYLSLLDETSASHIIINKSFVNIAATLQASRPNLQVIPITERGSKDLELKPVPDTHIMKGLDRTREKDYLAWIIHSSGSTGLPKPIRQTQRAAISNYAGNMNMRGFVTLPLYHAHGIASTFRAIYSRKQIHLYNAKLPLAKKHLLKVMREHDFEIFYGVPYVLKLLAEEEEGIRLLARCKIVMFGGSACPDALGDKLVEAGVFLMSHWGSTETGQLMTSMRPREDKDWDYFRPTEQVQKYLKFEERGDGLYEAVCLDGWPAKVATNRDDGSYAMKDLFTKHPTKENAWKFNSRLDDTIVLVNGEKAIPISLEGAVRQHKFVLEAVVFGSGKDCLGIAIVLSSEAADHSQQSVLEDIISSIESFQREMPAYAQISNDMVLLLPENTEYPRTDKGTVIRQAFYRQFEKDIDAMYIHTRLDTDTKVLSEPELRLFLRKAAVEIMPELQSIDDTTDFFSLGMDSLRATQMRNIILKHISTNNHTLGMNVVFDYPNVATLSQFLASLQTSTEQFQEVNIEAQMQQLIAEYGNFEQHIPSERAQEGHVIILTGATGSLGAHMAALLASRPDVQKVYCFIRSPTPEDAPCRLQTSLASRQLRETLSPSQQAKLIAISADLRKPDFGLAPALLASIKSELTAVIASAWSVNFNLSLSSFIADCIVGTKNLLDFCLSTEGPSPASFNFCSSVSTVSRFDGVTIPESVPVLTAAQKMGYAQSKLIVENLCQRAHAQTNMATRTLRIGQIIGDTQHGIWNATEAIPMMMQTSLTIGALPALDENLRWLPVDVVAAGCVDIATSMEAPSHVYNIVNTQTLHWNNNLLSTMKEAGISFTAVPPTEWVARLRASNQDPVVNPPIRLLEFFAEKYKSDEKRKEYAWETEAATTWSEALRNAKAPDAKVLKKIIEHFTANSW